MEYCSKGTKLSFSTEENGTYKNLYGMSSVPDMGGEKEKIDVTNLGDNNKRYIYGVSDFGDLAFEFFYNRDDKESSEKQVLNSYSALKSYETAETKLWWKLTYPDGTGHKWYGEPSVKRSGVGVNEALKFTLTISLENEITDFEPTGTQEG